MAGMNLKLALRGRLDDHELSSLIRGYDIMGDIAIIAIAEELDSREGEIAAALMQIVPHVRLVARRDGNCDGEFRTAPLRRIAGIGDYSTTHREFGVCLHVDPGRAYYSPRSGSERFRIASKVLSGERVLVMFSGIAPLPLMIGRHSQAAEVVGVEKNPEAHRLALRNLQANRRIKVVRLLEGDVMDIVPHQGKFARIAMPLPQSARAFLPLAVDGLAARGWLHYYAFKEKERLDEAIDEVRQACALQGRELLQAEIHLCGHVSPRRYRVCVDALVA